MSLEVEKVEVSNGEIIDVTLPEGWRRVWTGPTLPGDRCWHCLEGRWVDLHCCNRSPDAQFYACVIRLGQPGPDKACETCRYRVAAPGCRFCDDCIWRMKRGH